MRAVLEAGEHVWVVALTGDGGEALALAHQLRPTVTLLDDRIPAPGGADLVQAITQRSLVITLTQSTEPRAIYTKLCAPVRGCLVYGHFEPPDLLGAVRAVAAGLGWLSPVAVAAVTATMRESAVRATAPRPDGG